MKHALSDRVLVSRGAERVLGTVAGFAGDRYFVALDVEPAHWTKGGTFTESELSRADGTTVAGPPAPVAAIREPGPKETTTLRLPNHVLQFAVGDTFVLSVDGLYTRDDDDVCSVIGFRRGGDKVHFGRDGAFGHMVVAAGPRGEVVISAFDVAARITRLNGVVIRELPVAAKFVGAPVEPAGPTPPTDDDINDMAEEMSKGVAAIAERHTAPRKRK